MSLIKSFSELSKHDANIAGGKGASLGEMTQAGIPVPPGFVILAGMFDRFLQETDLLQEVEAQLAKVNHEDINSVDRYSNVIRSLIEQAVMPELIAQDIEAEFKKLGAEFVAVRSSATAEDSSAAAWAGQLDSFLNTTETTLLDNVKRCWSSLFTPRAIFYRFEKGLIGQQISVAVVVQKMVESAVSGIAFSVHPVTEDYNQIIIEAGFGLGEAIVSGQITPDSYVISKEPRQIIDINIAEQSKAIRRADGGNDWQEIDAARREQQKLSGQEIMALTEIILNIENHYGFPCDIEWAYEGGKFYIVQSRPITTLTTQEQKPKMIFNKTYTRDCLMILEEVFFTAQTKGCNEFIGEINSNHIPDIFFINNGLLEIWENRVCVQWIKDKLVAISQNNSEKIKQTILNYPAIYARLEKYWTLKEEQLIRVDINEYYKIFNEAASAMLIIFYLAGDERTPNKIKEEALAIRTKDNLMDGTDNFLRRLIQTQAPQLKGLENCLLCSDVANLSKNNIEEIKSLAMSRLKNWVYAPGFLNHIGGLYEIKEFIFESDKIFVQENTKLSGQIAFPGNVIGIVKILKKKDEVDKVNFGEIIVSPMTIPDFVPAMHKASAFVTDEGGITCHAAIIAREMKKPCIIGTKIATQVLHDGDEVEVDADHGVVRILKRNN